MYVCNQAAWVVTDILLQNNDEARTIFGGMHGESEEGTKFACM